MQMQNNAKIRTSGRHLMAYDLSSTAACFCSGDLNRVGISSCPLVREHMRDAKITMHHATYLALSFPSAVNHLVRGMGAVASIYEMGRQCLVRGGSVVMPQVRCKRIHKNTPPANVPPVSEVGI